MRRGAARRYPSPPRISIQAADSKRVQFEISAKWLVLLRLDSSEANKGVRSASERPAMRFGPLCLNSVSSLSSWRVRYATIFELKSSMNIGGLAVLRGLGGLTREIWAVFAKNTFAGD
jgi:hypothetical protein